MPSRSFISVSRVHGGWGSALLPQDVCSQGLQPASQPPHPGHALGSNSPVSPFNTGVGLSSCDCSQIKHNRGATLSRLQPTTLCASVAFQWDPRTLVFVCSFVLHGSFKRLEALSCALMMQQGLDEHPLWAQHACPHRPAARRACPR